MITHVLNYLANTTGDQSDRPPETTSTLSIQNVVGAGNLGTELDLQELAISLHGSEYDEDKIPAIVWNKPNPGTVMIFRSGKISITGAKHPDQIDSIAREIWEKLTEIDVPVQDTPPETTIENIVANTTIGESINLNAAVIAFGLENAEYEPEVFPGMVYRDGETGVVCMLFASGKLVVVGAKTIKVSEQAVERVKSVLRENNLLKI